MQCRYVSWSEFGWQQRDMEQAMSLHSPDLKINLSVFLFLYGTQAIALYIGSEVIVGTLLLFTRWKSLYFWSLNVSSLGLLLYTCFNLALNVGGTLQGGVMNGVGFVAQCFVATGFAMVLYSRLRTISQGQHVLLLRLVLASIVVVSAGLRITQVVLRFVSGT